MVGSRVLMDLLRIGRGAGGSARFCVTAELELDE
jgi:hypothetical protein